MRLGLGNGVTRLKRITGGGVASLGVNGFSAIGDSLTAGYLGTNGAAWPAKLSDATLIPHVNHGTVSKQLSAMNTDYATIGGPDYSASICNTMAIWAGINDIITAGAALSALQTSMTSLCSKARTTGFKVILLTLPACNCAGWTAGMETTRTGFNTWLRANYATLGTALCDLAADARLSNSANATYFNADQLHLTDAGYAVVASLFQTTIGATSSSAATTFDPLYVRGYNETLSNGNRTVTAAGGGVNAHARSVVNKSSGQFYVEMVANTVAATNPAFGLVQYSQYGGNYLGAPGTLGYYASGAVYVNDVQVATLPTFATGDIIGMKWDAGAQTVAFNKNNGAFGTPVSLSGVPGLLHVAVGVISGDAATIRFASSDWSYAAPSGFVAITAA